MGISLDLDAFCVSAKYVFTDTKKFGVIYEMHDDYDVWLKTDVTKRIAGIKVDHSWKWWHLGVLKSFRTKESKIVSLKTSSTRYEVEKAGFYDDTLEERLGGKKEYLGA